MSRKRPTLPPSDDPDSFARRIAEFLDWTRRRNYAANTTRRFERTLIDFARYCDDRSLTRPAEVTRAVLERYAKHLFQFRRKNGTPISLRSQVNILSVLKVFFRYLTRRDQVLFNPASDLEMPRVGHPIPRTVLTHEEMERVLLQPNLRTLAGVRDRAILETFYATGIRRAELIKLDLFDLDLTRVTLLVREGKGQKDRVVPLGERALDWNQRYLDRVRPAFLRSLKEQRLYITERGTPMTLGGLGNRVTAYVEAAELGKHGSCHLFRHTMATQMLEHGADVRVIQEMLGHDHIESTQIYTRVSIAHLAKEHARTHPTAKRDADRALGPLAKRSTPASIERAHRAEDHGAQPNDELDETAALESPPADDEREDFTF